MNVLRILFCYQMNIRENDFLFFLKKEEIDGVKEMNEKGLLGILKNVSGYINNIIIFKWMYK